MAIPFLDANDNIAEFSANDSNSALFEFKTNTASRIENDGTNDIKIFK